MAVEIPDTLNLLLGRWSIERVIEDHRAVATVCFSGAACVEPTLTGALYHESGQVSTDAHTGPARRSLGLSELDDGAVRVDFRDGRPFFDLDLSAGCAWVTHPCGADTYELSFEVLSPDALLERWWVTGPSKAYTAETVWDRR